LQEHCVIESTASALTLSPVSSAVCFVNGRQLDPGSNEVLAHNDRLILGNSQVIIRQLSGHWD